MTIKSSKIVKEILKNGCKDDEGHFYPLIYKYTMEGGAELHYALFLEPQHDDMDVSPYVDEVALLAANGILTVTGQHFIGEQIHRPCC